MSTNDQKEKDTYMILDTKGDIGFIEPIPSGENTNPKGTGSLTLFDRIVNLFVKLVILLIFLVLFATFIVSIISILEYEGIINFSDSSTVPVSLP